MAMRKGYGFRSHTADVELVAHGKTLDDAFANAALALFDTSADIAALSKMKSPSKKIKVKDKSSTLEELLWVMLQDALSIADAHSLYCYKVNSMKIKESGKAYSVAAEFSARKADQEHSVIYVKGVSRFDLKVARRKGLFTVRAVLDV